MSRKFFKDWNPSYKSEFLIARINEILAQYEEMGYKLTLRQLYYQLVSRDIIPNSMREYNKIGNVVNNGRLAGLIDWDMIEDRVRIPDSRAHWESPSEILDMAARMYYRSRWDNQDYYIEVWCEKDAVSNIIQPVCRNFDITFMANRGYSSQSAMYEGSLRLWEAYDKGKVPIIIYLGDHDPSGIDMTRDIEDRLGIFLENNGKFKSVSRIALNMDQVEKYNPPENPAKMTDSRFMTYVKTFGHSSWELDALEPKVLENLIQTEIEQYINWDDWNEVIELEEEHKKLLLEISNNLKGSNNA